MNKLSILVVTNMYPNENLSFYGVCVREEVECLRQRGVAADVIFINGRKSRWDYFKGLWRLLKALASKNYQIIHAHHTYCAFMALVCSKLISKKIPLVLTFHEGEIHSKNTAHYKMDLIERLKYLKFFKRFVMKRCDRVITVDRKLPKESSHSKYSLIPCGVNLELFKPLSRKQCRAKLNLNQDAKVIFFPSDWRRPEKRFDLVQQAYAILKKDYNGTLVLVKGGAIDYEQMPVYCAASDAVVLASDYEASPMVVKEALALNLALVSVDVGDVRNLIDGVAGCYLTRHDPQNIADNLKRAFNFKPDSRGRARILELGLSVDQVTSKIVAIYEQLLSQN